MHNACMTSITIRNVPDETRDALAARAKASGRSLQEYLVKELEELVSRPSQAELFARIRANVKSYPRLGPVDVVAMLDEDRDR